MKKGFIKITDTLYKNSWDIVYLIFKDFKPSHIEFRHWDNNIWVFYGESEYFKELKEGEPVPQYEAVVTWSEDKNYFVEFKSL